MDRPAGGPESETANWDLALSLVETPEGLGGRLVYNGDLFEAATVGRLLGHWRTLLEGILANPDQCLTDVPLLTAAEEQQLADRNGAAADAPPRAGKTERLLADLDRLSDEDLEA